MVSEVRVHEADETATDPGTLNNRGRVVNVPAGESTLDMVIGFAGDVLFPGYHAWITATEISTNGLRQLIEGIESLQPPSILHLRSPKQQQQVDLSEQQQQQFTARAFTDPYHGLGISTLHKALTCVLNGEEYAPVVGLFQSSGWGKSRTVCELWSQNVWVVYCSFSSGSGFPARSSISKWFCDQGKEHLGKDEGLKGQLMCMNFSLAYFVACLRVLADLGKSKKVFATEMWKGGEDYWRAVQVNILQFMKGYSDNPNLTRVMASKELTWTTWEKEAKSIFSQALGDLNLIQVSTELQVLFVFDEARHLVHRDLFLPIRRATRAMKDWKTLVIFMDTSSEITNFAAPDWADPSDRVSAGAFLLPPPIWGSFTADISEEDSLLPQFFWGKTFQDVVNPFRAVRYGRPLWWATFKSLLQPKEASKKQEEIPMQTVGATFRQVYELAQDKLMGGAGKWAEYLTKGNALPEQVALALLGVSIEIDVDPHAKLASNMVANNLLTVVSVSPARDLVWTAWCPEPLVAKAAGEAMERLHGSGRSRELYEPLVQGLAAGWVHRGDTGELVARIILLHAMHKTEQLHAMHKTEQDECGNVNNFCKHLVGKSLLELIEQPAENHVKLAQARIRFNSFRRIYKKVSELTFDDVRKCIERGFAVICDSGTWGVDILIFVFTGSDGEELTVANVTVIFCQVKMRKQDGSNICFAKISPQYAGLALGGNLPYLSLYMNVKDKKKARSYVVATKEIRSAVEKHTSNSIKVACEELEKEKASSGADLMDIDEVNNKAAVQAWKAWLQADTDLQTVLVVKGLNAFELDDGLKDQLKQVVKTSREPFRTDSKNKLHKQLLDLQKKSLDDMFKVVNIGNYRQ